ncbi:PTS transporter subunit EIIC [Succiniclasticum ruminis]|uniref:PTS system, sucrose-specific IIC component n=1 Tax=Succiniclasticum ruminis DSM 9236 TaxID=1123323 RepID=A0A1I1Y537_9FIRM|nr:PTS transporter subunit EIIC [Succiniclasticum ruminis]SFE14088.1 PTS system, sucrose-specific IIC component [Succiniclasticum ruminis DSM 9236]
MDNQQIARSILAAVGPENITEAYNCMTRLRLRVSAVTVTKEQLKKIAGVKGVILNDGEIHVVLGPGKAENVAKECKRLLAEQEKTKAAAQTVGAEPAALSASHSVSENPKPAPAEIQKPENKIGDGKALHAEIKKRNSRSVLKRMLQRVGHIFIPLIPAFIGCGLLTGLVSLLLKISPELAGNSYIQYLKLAGGSIFTVLNAFIGLYACKEFGGTPALGGAMAALLTAPGLADITFMGSPLIPGRGGIFASLLVGAATALIETRLRKRIPESLSLFLTPLVTITVVALAGLFVFQPLGGVLSDVLSYYTVHSIQTGGAVTGFVIGGLFLPIVMVGVHHGLTPIHADMLASMGMTILLPIAAMAGCGQVGASFAVYLKSKNKMLRRTILSSLPVGMLGIGEPLIYGVTLPLGKPFVCACIGGAFGGAWQAYHGIGSYALGISGIPLAAATNHVLLYLIGVLIAYLAGFAATWVAGFEDPPEEEK